MSSLFEKMMALNTPGPYRGERVTAETALKGGRHPVLDNPPPHAVLGTPLSGDEDPRWRELCDSPQEIILGLGCFWGVERLYWGLEGVLGTSVGYAGGFTANPTYREVCTGRTGHAEVVRVVFDPQVVSLDALLKVAFENHDPTLGDRQGNDVGTQYRSCIFTSDAAQRDRVNELLGQWQRRFSDAGYGRITTEVECASDAGDGQYYLAEVEHQQYLHKNPDGYCNHGPNGVSCPIGVL